MSTAGETAMIFFFQAEDGIRDVAVTGVQTCALPISRAAPHVGGDLAGEVEQIVIDEEEPAEPVALDEPQLLGEPPLRLAAVQGVDRIALFEPRAAQLGEGPGGGRALRSV